MTNKKPLTARELAKVLNELTEEAKDMPVMVSLNYSTVRTHVYLAVAGDEQYPYVELVGDT